jgi:hypothetical protein
MQTIDTRFGAEDYFGAGPVPSAPLRGATETELDSLKARLLKDLLGRMPQLDAATPMRRAANEAAALAWLTPFPLLVFPTLFEERARQLKLQLGKQSRVRARSEGLIAAAA